MTRSDVSIVLAACIVAASLIASAIILTPRPAAAVTAGQSGAILAAKPMGTPPVAQTSVTEQFRAQVLASPTLHSFPYNGKNYLLADIKVNQVIYAAKEDVFTVTYSYIWQPTMPPSGPQNSECALNNDGYGHYYDTAVINDFPAGSHTQSADITIK